MKGFPNQISDLGKLAHCMRIMVQLAAEGKALSEVNIGVAWVRAKLMKPRDKSTPIETYIKEQLTKKSNDQSITMTPRGIIELFVLLGFIEKDGTSITITPRGMQAAVYAGSPLSATQKEFWRDAISSMYHFGRNSTEASHPYLVMLKLVARKPGISRAMCALALEAKNDSTAELDRITNLASMTEAAARAVIGTSKNNWDNAKKILPAFAEQLGDVVKLHGCFWLAVAPGQAGQGKPAAPPPGSRAPSAPKTARSVNSKSVARTDAEFDEEIPLSAGISAEQLSDTIALRKERLHRHNKLAQQFTRRIEADGRKLYADPFDLLALIGEVGVLVEFKTLNGKADDQQSQVCKALAQLLYYETFVAQPIAGQNAIRKVACFESSISRAHAKFLNAQDIGVIWKEGEDFIGDDLAKSFLGEFIEEFR